MRHMMNTAGGYRPFGSALLLLLLALAPLIGQAEGGSETQCDDPNGLEQAAGSPYPPHWPQPTDPPPDPDPDPDQCSYGDGEGAGGVQKNSAARLPIPREVAAGGDLLHGTMAFGDRIHGRTRVAFLMAETGEGWRPMMQVVRLKTASQHALIIEIFKADQQHPAMFWHDLDEAGREIPLSFAWTPADHPLFEGISEVYVDGNRIASAFHESDDLRRARLVWFSGSEFSLLDLGPEME